MVKCMGRKHYKGPIDKNLNRNIKTWYENARLDPLLTEESLQSTTRVIGKRENDLCSYCQDIVDASEYTLFQCSRFDELGVDLRKKIHRA